MQMLYDSDAFVVVYVDVNAEVREKIQRYNERARSSVHRRVVKPMPKERHCFEIVDKRSNMEVFLQGEWAASFQRTINSWQLNTPSQDEVETVLDQFCTLAQIPLVVH